MVASPQLLRALELKAKLQGHGHANRGDAPAPDSILTLDGLGLEGVLPDGGLPRGAVVELSGPAGLGQIPSLALHACRRAQAQDERPWCAFLDPSRSLHAPGVVRAGVDLERLLVVYPAPEDIGRVAVRLVSSGIFALVAIDRAGVPGVASPPVATRTPIRWPTVVRRLALAAESSGTTILLLSAAQTHAPRAENARSVREGQGLPVALRLELSRPRPDELRLRVAKDRRGRLGHAVVVPPLLDPSRIPA